MVVEQPILEAIRLSHVIGLEVDEPTDMSLTRQLDIHIRYLYIQSYKSNLMLDK